jgi:ribose transport system substrate-binding protein
VAGSQHNGVDAAIALLLALTKRNGEAKTSVLRSEIGTPRASIHRIVRALAKEGLVEAPRGRLRVGPLAKRLIAANSEAVKREEAAQPMRGSRRQRRPALCRATEAEQTGVVSLSRPASYRRGGRFKIGFSNASMDNLWRVALVHTIEYAAANLVDNIEWLTVLHAHDDARQQEADIESMIAQGVDGLIVSAVASPRIDQTIARTMARGVAVVLVDRGVAPGVPRTSFVTSDDATIGRLTATWLTERLGGKGSILLLAGDRAAEPARIRLRAAQSVFAQVPSLQILGTEWTGWRRDIAREIVRPAIERWRRNIAGVWCDSGLQGAGSLQAFLDAGYRPGEIPPHTGGDLNLAYKLAIQSRTALAGVDFPPSMGIKALETLLCALRGGWTPSSVQVACEVVITKGAATRSISPDLWAEDHVRWDLPDDLVLASGLGPAYNPRSFRIHYPGNIYNRSAARARPRISA